MSAARVFWSQKTGKWVVRVRLLTDDGRFYDSYPALRCSFGWKVAVVPVPTREAKSIAADSSVDIAQGLSAHWKDIAEIQVKEMK